MDPAEARMDKEKLQQRLMGIFLEELDRYIESLNADLSGLRNDPNGPDRVERVARLHRDSHGLKGAACAAGIPSLQRAFLGLERLMAAVREGQRPLDSEVIDLLGAAAEVLAGARQCLGATNEAGGSHLDALLPRLEAVAGSPR